MNLNQKLSSSFLGFILILSVSMYFVYRASVPPLVNEQVNLRMQTLADTFRATITSSVITQNFLQVNQAAEVAAPTAWNRFCIGDQ